MATLRHVSGAMTVSGWELDEWALNGFVYSTAQNHQGEISVYPEHGDSGGESRQLWLRDSLYTYREVLQSVVSSGDTPPKGEVMLLGDVWLQSMRERGLLLPRSASDDEGRV